MKKSIKFLVTILAATSVLGMSIVSYAAPTPSASPVVPSASTAPVVTTTDSTVPVATTTADTPVVTTTADTPVVAPAAPASSVAPASPVAPASSAATASSAAPASSAATASDTLTVPVAPAAEPVVPDATITNTVIPANQSTLYEVADLKIAIASLLGTVDYVSPQLVGGEEYVFLPANADITNLVMTYKTGMVVSLTDGTNSVPVLSGTPIDASKYLSKSDSRGVRTLKLLLQVGNDAFEYELKVMQSANIASMFICSKDPNKKGLYYVSSNKDNKSTGNMNMINADGSLVYSGDLSQIKTRGNSTWISVKKPFQIKLSTKVDLIQTGDEKNASKTWILLANSYDPTLLHNSAAYNMAAELGLNAPDNRSVDLFFDGRYLGTYLLCEKVESGKGRVDIGDTGFLMEMDVAYYAQEENYVVDSLGNPFVIKAPEKVSAETKQYLQTYMDDVILAATNGGISPNTGLSISDLVDMDSLAKLYLLEETVKDPDAFVSSIYFYLPTGGKLTAGPVWDFDSSFGIRDENNMTLVSGVASTAGWINNFYTLPEFKKAVKKNEASMYKIANKYANTEITKMVNEISASQRMNAVCWSDFKLGIYNEKPVYAQNITVFKNFLRNRNNWVRAYVNSMR